MRLEAIMAASLLAAGGPAAAEPVKWPHWEAYKAHFLNRDGRIVDFTSGDRTTSEGQAYALFFALVDNDQAAFERLLSWTRTNLASKDLASHLPSWLWGQDDQWKWRVLDVNSASDADVWLAYVLIEAGRLWNNPEYDRQGRALADLVARNEVATLPDLGPMLLPGPSGFVLKEGEAWRLNPSYLAPAPLRRLAAVLPSGPWSGVVSSSLTLLRKGTRSGFVPDWIRYQKDGGFDADPISGAVGSYDAIRVYLWLGMLPANDAWRQSLAAVTNAMPRYWSAHGSLPVHVNTTHPEGESAPAPPGFLGVLSAEARTRGDVSTSAAIESELAKHLTAGLYGMPPAYYDQNLLLFARGFTTGLFRFQPDGSLCPSWRESCH